MTATGPDPATPHVDILLSGAGIWDTIRYDTRATAADWSYARQCRTLTAELIGAARAFLGAEFDIATDFTPQYLPWHQRLAVIPGGDPSVAIREGRAEVLTDRIDHLTPTGLRLASGPEMEADVFVTGLDPCMFGDLADATLACHRPIAGGFHAA